MRNFTLLSGLIFATSLLFTAKTYADDVDCKDLLLSPEQRAEETGVKRLPRPVPENESIVRYGSPREEAVPVGQPLKLVIWNVQKFKNDQTLQLVERFYEESQFVLLQESRTGSTFGDFFSQMFNLEWIGAIGLRYEDESGAGVKTGTRFSVREFLPIRSRPKEPVLHTPKMALVTEHPIAGRDETLAIVNLHGINFVPTRKFSDQIQQVYEVVKGHVGPLIVAGDFNTYTKGRLQILQAFADALSLYRVPLANDHRVLRLDHIMVRGVEVEAAELLSDIRTSDHAPIRVRAWLK